MPRTDLDANQAIKYSFDENNEALKVNIVAGSTAHIADHTTDDILVYGNDGTNNQKIKTDANGRLQTDSAITFTKDGSLQAVIEDTVTPANNAPLPVKITSATGPINITAGDINVQTSHAGASYDSMRIGDGTDLLAIASDGSIAVTDNGASLTVDGSVSISSSALPTGAATETTLSAINTKTPALGTALIAASTPVNIASDQTVPVSAASLPLPTGASTSALQTTGNTSLGTIAGAVAGTEMQVDIVASLPAGTNNIGDVDVLTQPARSHSTDSIKVGDGTDFLAIAADGSIAVTDNGSSLTVDGSVSITGTPAVTQSGTWAVRTQDGSGNALTSKLSGTNRGLNTSEVGLSVVDFARVSYDSTPVTTAAYVELKASLAAECQEIEIFESGGNALYLATGAAASEVNLMLVFPGGNGRTRVRIPASTRLSLKAVAINSTLGEILVNFLG